MKNYLKVVAFSSFCSLISFADANAATCPSGITYNNGDSAYFLSQEIPSSMESGKSYTVKVTFCNNGSTSWTYRAPPSNGDYSSYIRLASYPGDTSPLVTARVDLVSGDNIVPGAAKTFSFNVVAPTTTLPSVANIVQYGMVRDGVARFAAGPAQRVTSFYTPAITLQNPPTVAPVFVNTSGPGAFSFANFRGANVFNQTYAEAGRNHTKWIPNATQMATIASAAKKMNLNYIRIPIVIPPDASNSEYIASEWYPVTSGTANQTNVNAVINATQAALNVAQSNGLKVILALDGYTEYDAACNTQPPNGAPLWKKSFVAVKNNAATIISALSSNSALYAWDLLNEPLWNAYSFGCLAVSPTSLDRGTQSPQITLPNASATMQSITEVVEAVHAMYNVVRANDPYKHPTTVGEGTAAYVRYWTDISSFASPHFYVSPQSDIIDLQAAANNGQSAAVQFTQFTGAPLSKTAWKMSDPAIQSQVTGLVNATISAWKDATVDSSTLVPLPLVLGEYGASIGGELQSLPGHDLQADQASLYALFLSSLSSASQSIYTSVNVGGLFWSLQSTPGTTVNFSLIDSAGNLSPAACVVATKYGPKPSGCL